MKIFQELIPSLRLVNWAPSSIRKHLFGEESQSITELCRMMMDSDGEYSSLLLAERILNAFEKLDEEGQSGFYELLNAEYDLDIDLLQSVLKDYQQLPDAKNLYHLTQVAEPGRQELLRRINLAQEGTRRLVKIREGLLKRIKQHPELKRSDNDFRHLFNSWFSRGFLLMQPIDWTTPAHILEKIIAYEAVHEIGTWSELRSRLEPRDRYCYAFFHPSMEDEPLVFVEVALSMNIPINISEVLNIEREEIDPEEASCAIFYSISNCHAGLAGVSFGNFLIKQVATSLKQRFPQLKKFATISPAPMFRSWLQAQAVANPEIATLVEQCKQELNEIVHERLRQQAARYYLHEKNSRNEPFDPVARFHLKNGAILDRINPAADYSEKGLQQSFGLMVNYVYDLARVEDNHENYMKNHQIVCSSQVSKVLN
ncbi:MAG: malonyl-CoA decarboxylase [Gammaproteobacteria bacterium]|nr:malonyl-CoA decarboxylase [Gammaproteobacteria bacterium]